MFVKIRVLLAGNSPLKNQGIHSALTTTATDLTIIETTTEPEQMPELYSLHQPDLLLVVLDGWENSLLPIFHRLPPTNILGLSSQNEQACHTFIRQNIVNGCLPETASPELLARAVLAIASGHTWFSQALFKQILHPTLQSRKTQHNLTDQELAILRLIIQDKTNESIGLNLGIGTRTVSGRLSTIYEKLGVASRLEAALKAERLGLIEE